MAPWTQTRLFSCCRVTAVIVAAMIASHASAVSCCLPDGSCLPLSEEFCIAFGGFFDAESDCATIDCSSGACCYAQLCEPMSLGECQALGGEWAGGGVSCAEAECARGACCLTSGELSYCEEDYSEEDCLVKGGTFNGIGSSCTSGLCDPVGVCCINESGACLIVTEAECPGIDVWWGPGTTCEEIQCISATGACCFDDGYCEEDVWEDMCWDSGGVYRGTGSLCAEVDCCPWDIDESGIVGFGDLVALIAAWGPCAAFCSADLNFSLVVDLQDLLVLLSHWGNCDF